MDSVLPKYATLGITSPGLSILSWYLACTHPEDFQALQKEIETGRQILNPIDAFETIIRNNSPIENYKTALDYAYGCFESRAELAKEATRFLVKWEPQLKKEIQNKMMGINTPLSTHDWPPEKFIAFALITTQMLAQNWNHPKYKSRWITKLSTFKDGEITSSKLEQSCAQAYWKTMAVVPEQWVDIVWQGLHSRIKPKDMDHLNQALKESHAHLIARADPAVAKIQEHIHHQLGAIVPS